MAARVIGTTKTFNHNEKALVKKMSNLWKFGDALIDFDEVLAVANRRVYFKSGLELPLCEKEFKALVGVGTDLLEVTEQFRKAHEEEAKKQRKKGWLR